MTDFDNKNEECIKMFCKTLAELNEISLKQMEGLLNIAVTAAGELKSESNTADAEKFVNDLKTTAETIGQNAKTREDDIDKNVKAGLSGEPEHSFCRTVEQKILLAMDNSLSLQQQLNVTGEAILSQAASLILSQDVKTDS